MEFTVKNYKRDRRFGWGWTTQPTGHGTEIETPGAPSYLGTLAQLRRERATDAAFNSLGGAFYNTAWFYQGKRITHTWVYTIVETADDLPGNPDTVRSWWVQNQEHHYKNDRYGYAWVPGFRLDLIDPDDVLKIRTAD